MRESTSVFVDATDATPPKAKDYTTDYWVSGITICIGIIGIVGNATVLGFVYVAKRKKKHSHLMNTFIINQTAIDFVACLIMTLFFMVNIPPLRIMPQTLAGHLDCALVGGEGLLWMMFLASTIGLEALTMDRYIKVVHPIRHRNVFTKKLRAVFAAATWLIPALWLLPFAIKTTRVVNGICYIQAFWPSRQVLVAYTWTYLSLFFFIPIAMFIFCYSHMFYVLNARTKQGHGGTAMSTAQVNIIRTLVIVSVAFVLLWAPVNYKYLRYILSDNPNSTNLPLFNSIADMMCYSNSVINPIIYAFKITDIRRFIKVKLCCQSNQVAPFATTNSKNNSTRVQSIHQ